MLPQRGKLSKACVICHKKKIKCDLTETNQPCTNCRNGDYTCRPHQRKRKHYSVSPVSPLEDGSIQGSQATVDITRAARVGASPASITDFGTSPATYLITEDENSAAAAAIGLQHLRNNPGASTHQSPLSRPSPQDKPVTEQTYVGRSDYLGGHQVPFSDEVDVPSPASSPKTSLEDIDLRYLQLKKAFDLPPRTTRTSLIDAFMDWCHPWTPIVERQWLDDPKPSLLLQSVFLAGSRVLSSPLIYASSKDYYERAKTLFFQGHERNTLLSIVSVCLLQWWNPTGPEKISTSTSGFWVRIGVGLAYQVGLHLEPADGPFKSFRRRLWWSLVCRDCIISIGVGRPRAINLEDATVKPPSVDDFPLPDFKARLFVAYVSICRHMGDIAEALRRRTLTSALQQRCENSLFRWLKELPPQLRLFHGDQKTRVLAPYSFEARQLAIPYFVSLIILHRRSNGSAAVPTTCLMASSFVVGIFEDFISRDQLRYLGPVFAFYALAAGLVQLTGYRYEATINIAEHAFDVIRITLEQLGQRWGSAHGALRSLSKAKEAILRQPQIQDQPIPLRAEAAIFFEDFGPDLCRHWHLGGVDAWAAIAHDPATASVDADGLNVWDYERSGMVLQPGLVGQESMGTFPPSALVPEASLGFDEMQLFDEFQVPMGSWLFEDYETLGI